MKTTSLELSKQIYAAFPEWDDTSSYWTPDTDRQGNRQYVAMSNHYSPPLEPTAPAYDTDYLLDMLPEGVTLVKEQLTDKYNAGLPRTARVAADTPAEALGLLVLELKKAGIKI